MKKQIQYIFFLIISLQLLTSHQKKIELTLSKLDSTSETHLFLDSNEKNMTFIKTSAEFRLQGYSFNLEGDKRYSDGNIVYLLNEPHVLTQLYRCKKSSQKLKSENFSSFSIYDDFGQTFDLHFLKKSFEIIMSDPNEKLINYNCRALMIDHRDLEIDLKNFINRMMSFMINELFPEDPNVSLESNFLKFNENDKFNSKINFVDNKIESLSIEIFNKNFVFPQSLPIKNFFLSRNKKNKLKILDFLNSNVLNSTIYTFNPASNSLIHQNDIKSSYMNYTSNFIKNVTGSGLHQQANLDFFFESNTQQLSKEIYKGKCSLIVIDYLDDTNYIDIEEMINDPTYKLMTFNVIDIEKPSSVSFQHMYIIKYQLKFENKIFELNQTKLHVSLKYPIHFRYRKPHNDLKYKKAFINRRPEFYFDCLNLNYYNNNTFQTPNDILVNGKISKVMARVSSIAVKKKENFDNLVVFVPTGNLEDLPLVLMVTLIITTGAAVYISKKILGMNKKETVKKQI